MYYGGPGSVHALDRWDPDHRNVETHVLIGFCHLDYDEGSASRNVAGAENHRVGPFHCFNRNDRSIFYRDRLPKVEPGNLARDSETILDIRKLFFRRRAT